MGLRKRVYSVLVVSAAQSFNSALAPLLPEAAYHPVQHTASISAAKRALAERAFDFVLINSPLPDSAGVHLAIDTSLSGQAVVLLLVKNEIHDAVYEKAAPYGVFLLPKPTAKTVLIQALRWLTSARERCRSFEKRNLSIENKMEEIRIVNKAKWLLISQKNLSEEEAHHYIEKQAMNACISKKNAAQAIIKNLS